MSQIGHCGLLRDKVPSFVAVGRGVPHDGRFPRNQGLRTRQAKQRREAMLEWKHEREQKQQEQKTEQAMAPIRSVAASFTLSASAPSFYPASVASAGSSSVSSSSGQGLTLGGLPPPPPTAPVFPRTPVTKEQQHRGEQQARQYHQDGQPQKGKQSQNGSHSRTRHRKKQAPKFNSHTAVLQRACEADPATAGYIRSLPKTQRVELNRQFVEGQRQREYFGLASHPHAAHEEEKEHSGEESQGSTGSQPRLSEREKEELLSGPLHPVPHLLVLALDLCTDDTFKGLCFPVLKRFETRAWNTCDCMRLLWPSELVERRMPKLEYINGQRKPPVTEQGAMYAWIKQLRPSIREDPAVVHWHDRRPDYSHDSQV